MSGGKLCEFCDELVKLASRSADDPGAFTLQKNTCFQETVSSCDLCGLLYNGLRQQYSETAVLTYDTEGLLPHEIHISFNFSLVPEDQERTSEAEIRFQNRATSQNWGLTLALWAEQGKNNNFCLPAYAAVMVSLITL